MPILKGTSLMDATARPQQELAHATHLFSFKGTAREYFGIWIVNILLTILTLGIYSAWAKVRRNRYFYGNTFLNGRSFDYHAQPMQILIGRAIVIALLIAYNLVLTFAPLAGIVVVPAFILFIPWMIMRGLRFAARVTSYRNVRFDFTGRYGGAFAAFLLGGILSAITLGILAPVASRITARYLFNNLSYGGKWFFSDPQLKKLYGVWWLPALMALLGFVILGTIAAAMVGAFSNLFEEAEFGDNGEPPVAFIAVVVLVYAGIFIVYGAANLLYRAGVRNVTYTATLFDDRHNLLADMPRWRYAWIAFSNIIVTLLTVGLMRPWAAVRMARFTAQHTALDVEGEIGDIFADIRDEGSAAGSEFMDVEGIDFGF
jgi:uncharacterized membrane protein YjgN (DUF898 family)